MHLYCNLCYSNNSTLLTYFLQSNSSLSISKAQAQTLVNTNLLIRFSFKIEIVFFTNHMEIELNFVEFLHFKGCLQPEDSTVREVDPLL